MATIEASSAAVATAAAPAATTVKLTVALPSGAVEAVERLAGAKQTTKTQILREAIALKAFIEEELAQPGTHLLIERDGTTRQIVFS